MKNLVPNVTKNGTIETFGSVFLNWSLISLLCTLTYLMQKHKRIDHSVDGTLMAILLSVSVSVGDVHGV